ncbi:G/U mismatch-specific DNA glycosylase [Streptomyces sp. NPDC048567]|uniref:G/U mismatch-specific DNA glycosylase n=1 Tax=Streptomyces sp. NPDC048567 TaxID=3365570 RepID=UPI0037153519
MPPEGRPRGRRATASEREAARTKELPDLVTDGLRLLLCGINPGLGSAAAGHHFANPGNRLWPALFRAGFTPRVLSGGQERELLPLGIGITSLVRRPTARAAELTRAELREGARDLRTRVRALRPDWLAMLGIGTYRTAFDAPQAVIGPQETVIGPTRVWVLPNPSGLNAHYPPVALAREFARLREAMGQPSAEAPPGR